MTAHKLCHKIRRNSKTMAVNDVAGEYADYKDADILASLA